jgi:hypothetical protein
MLTRAGHGFPEFSQGNSGFIGSRGKRTIPKEGEVGGHLGNAGQRVARAILKPPPSAGHQQTSNATPS